MSKRNVSLVQPHFSKKSKMAAKQSLDAGCSTVQKEEEEEENQPKTYLDNLNDDCLIAIFELLGENDWIRLCEYNDRFCSLVVNHVVPRKLFDFGKMSYKVDIENVFKMFGENLRKIKINELDMLHTNTNPQYTRLDEFLSLVQTHCAEDEIVDLNIAFTIRFSQHTEQLLVQVIPFIRNVVSLRVSVYGGSQSDAVKFLKMLPIGNVRSIELIDFESIDFNWLRAMPFGNLHHLRIGGLVNMTSLETFFESQPNLKTFHCGEKLITCLELIAKRLPNIEEISPIKTKHYNITAGAVVDSTHVIETWLHKLYKLKTMEIVAQAHDGSDLYEVLDCVSENNVLSSLVVRFRLISGRSVELKNVDFSNLTHLNLIVPRTHCQFAQSNQKFIDDFVRVGLPHMTNVKKIRFNCFNKNNKLNQNDVLQIVKVLKQLYVLDIKAKVNFTKAFYQKLVKARTLVQNNQDRFQHRPISIGLPFDEADRYRALLGDAYDSSIVEIGKIVYT